MTADLKHIAFIMDGNRRWARKKGLPVAAGHKKGADTLIEIAKCAKNKGIKYMTVYAFSTENWQRSADEVQTLMNLLRNYLDDGFSELKNNDARIVFIGERNMLDADIVAKMETLERETLNNRSVVLCVALSYGSRQEILAATRKLAMQVKNGNLQPEEITEEVFENALYTRDIPAPDLIIRTSGEQRLSNYLLWQSAYAELFFTETLWPDFSKTELEEIIDNYNKRERRYGKS